MHVQRPSSIALGLAALALIALAALGCSDSSGTNSGDAATTSDGATSGDGAAGDGATTGDAATGDTAVGDAALGDAATGDAATGDAATGDASCAAVAARVVRDIAYHKVAGVDAKLLSLDIYAPARADGCSRSPVVVWVHGGGWAVGDKANQITNKVTLMRRAGYLLVSVNYRLSPATPSTDPNRVKFPTHPQDVARAVGWVVKNIDRYGGDTSRIALMGHSAGAHLVALVGTDAALLSARGVALKRLRCVAALDTQAFNVALVMTQGSASSKATYANAFGQVPADWRAASPLNHVAAGKDIPPFLTARRGNTLRRQILAAFDAALKAASIASTIIDASSLNHAEVNTRIGAAGDTVMTPPLMAFLKGCFAP